MTTRKKQTRYFEIYVLKFLKQKYPDNSLNLNTKQHLNSAVCHLATHISKEAKSSCLHANRRTIKDIDVVIGVKILTTESLREKIDAAVNEMNEKLLNINNTVKKDLKGKRREVKFDIVFPPSVAEKFLREKGSNSLMVSKNSSIILCIILEVIINDIFSNAVKLMDKRKKRLTIQSISRAVNTDSSLKFLFNKCNIQFTGGGYTSFIHPLLSVKSSKNKHDVIENNKKTRRYNPGTIVLKEIKKLQNVYNQKIIAKVPFNKVIREIFSEKKCNSKISKNVFNVLQYYIESYLVNLLHKSNIAALHSGRLKVIPEDIDFVHSIENNILPMKIQILLDEDS